MSLKSLNQDKVLQEVKEASRPELFQLLSFFDKNLPENAEVHSMILAALATRNCEYSVFFIPESDDNNRNSYLAVAATKIVLDKKADLNPAAKSKGINQKYWVISVWGSEPAVSRLFHGIRKLNWKTDGFVLATSHNPFPLDFFGLAGDRSGDAKQIEKVHLELYVLDITAAQKINISIPSDVYVKSLERCNAKTVFDYWQPNYSTNVENIGDEIDELPSAGLFLKETDHLVSWIKFNSPAGLSCLHTLEEHRKKGYAFLVIQYMSKRLAQAGHVPFALIHSTNVISQQLFEKLGFRKIYPYHILKLKQSS